MSLETDPVSFSVAPDVRVLGFTMAVTLITGVLFGLAPVLRAGRIDVASALKRATGSVAGNPSRQRLQQSLVVAQMGLSLMLLVGAGLFVQTLRKLKGMEMGFNRSNVVQFEIDFVQGVESNRRSVLYKEVLAELEGLPGVQTASLYGFGLLSGNGWSDRVVAEGHVATPGEELTCQGTLVGPRFLETLGMRMLSGRDFTAQDGLAAGLTNAPLPAVINQTMARRYFGEADPVGRRFYFPEQPQRKFEIIGVVKDAKYGSLRQDSPPTFYAPSSLNPYQPMTIVVRTRDARTHLTLPTAQQVVRRVFAAARVEGFKKLDDVVDAAVRQERVVAQLGSFFSLLSLGLACLGLYGVLSFAVVQRTREIGVRVALGAQQADVLSLIVGKGLKLAFLGATIGMAGAVALTRLISNLLYGVTPTDPTTLVSVVGLLVSVAFLACWMPARSAARVNPIEALRQE
jgi:predicted permease